MPPGDAKGLSLNKGILRGRKSGSPALLQALVCTRGWQTTAHGWHCQGGDARGTHGRWEGTARKREPGILCFTGDTFFLGV